jgi:hypothetical protein
MVTDPVQILLMGTLFGWQLIARSLWSLPNRKTDEWSPTLFSGYHDGFLSSV